MIGHEQRHKDLVAELRGFAEGSTSARASLMRDAADAIERLAAPTVGTRIPGDEIRVDSPSYSVRRLLSALDGIATSDEEFSTAAEFVDAGGTITIRDSQGFPLYELSIQGHPTSEEEMDD